MANILILTHEYDGFSQRDYVLKGLCAHWQRAGHHVVVTEGIPSKAEADIVILHTDVSAVPDAYLDFAAQFPVIINGGARDIRKSVVSRELIRPGDRWHGPVIVKSELNSGGSAEALHNLAASLRQRPSPYPNLQINKSYPIYQSMAEVPETVWSDRSLVVERFLPEQDKKGYWKRVWTFFGDGEHCSRYCAPDPVFLPSNATDRELAPVPDELRAERRRLGFDYGVFDFVIHKGKPVLLDANRTPAIAGGINARPGRFHAILAAGIDGFLRAAP